MSQLPLFAGIEARTEFHTVAIDDDDDDEGDEDESDEGTELQLPLQLVMA